jgi:hypothetical protein
MTFMVDGRPPVGAAPASPAWKPARVPADHAQGVGRWEEDRPQKRDDAFFGLRRESPRSGRVQSPLANEIVRAAKQDVLRETAARTAPKRRSTLELGGDSGARRNGGKLRPLSPMELPSAQRDTPNAGSRREVRAQPSPYPPLPRGEGARSAQGSRGSSRSCTSPPNLHMTGATSSAYPGAFPTPVSTPLGATPLGGMFGGSPSQFTASPPRTDPTAARPPPSTGPRHTEPRALPLPETDDLPLGVPRPRAGTDDVVLGKERPKEKRRRRSKEKRA